MESYGLETPGAVLTIQTLDDDGNSGEYVLRIGTEDAQKEGFVMKSSESPYYVFLADHVVRGFRREWDRRPACATSYTYTRAGDLAGFVS